jgi:aspartyl-tRNA synthetase
LHNASFVAYLINPKLATGEIEIVADTIEILNASKPVPFQIDAVDTSEEVRLKYRFLDLRTNEWFQLKQNFCYLG